MKLNKISKLALSLFSVYALTATPAHALVTYAADATTTSTIPSLTGFSTDGAMMDGMQVTATFSGGLTQTVSWADTGPTSGGVTGSGWGLSLTGDSFAGLWNFVFSPTAQLGAITQLILNGNTGFTVFDRSLPAPGTNGSANGHDLSFTDSTINALVTFSDQVALTGAAPVGDLWHVVTVDFTDGLRGDFAFVQDTDNDSRITNRVPEPTVLGLFGIGLLAAGLARKNRKA
ncbi:PEP-CTERM sorting domain-containing protein [Sulfurirhabdus autotrophica]|uniref:Putative secreted protein with PEP-CTERM sorting signal n=1 Tax=Sulfurirhabdus autotrophica TaxID=1706046 RepID=A0A4R3XXI5_9PROT|nr:PEP-CTERM sorting domain-containing protein [Sulfurirhabdus autotrophica]TCV82333.1 putative secreted protein with PEP-CTERM sorting signal [Sulfurirhabdus autotrophica]